MASRTVSFLCVNRQPLGLAHSQGHQGPSLSPTSAWWQVPDKTAPPLGHQMPGLPGSPALHIPSLGGSTNPRPCCSPGKNRAGRDRVPSAHSFQGLSGDQPAHCHLAVYLTSEGNSATERLPAAPGIQELQGGLRHLSSPACAREGRSQQAEEARVKSPPRASLAVHRVSMGLAPWVMPNSSKNDWQSSHGHRHRAWPGTSVPQCDHRDTRRVSNHVYALTIKIYV